MPNKREVLALIDRKDLLALVSHYEIDVDTRSRPKVIEALANARKVKLEDVLADYNGTELKGFCEALGLEGDGRKGALIDRLTATAAAKPAARKAMAVKPAAKKPVSKAIKSKAAPVKAKPAAQAKGKTKSVAKDPSEAVAKAKGKTKPVAKDLSEAVVAKAKKPKSQTKATASAGKAAVAKPTIKRRSATLVAVPTSPVEPPDLEDLGSTQADATTSTDVEEQSGMVTPHGQSPRDTDTTARPHYTDPVVPRELQNPEPRACAHCRKKVALKKCQVHKCPRVFPEAVPWKICAECLFERGGLSFEEFSERHRAEAACPLCSKTWASRSKSA